MNWEFLFNIRWPHEGIMLGYEVIDPDDFNQYYTIKLHFLFFSIFIHYGSF